MRNTCVKILDKNNVLKYKMNTIIKIYIKNIKKFKINFHLFFIYF